MSQPNVYKAVQVTAPVTAQALLAVLQAIDPSILGTYREVNLQCDPNNTTNNNVLVGDDQLSTSRVGVVLVPGASRNYREGLMAGVPIANIYILQTGSGPSKLNVELMM